MIWPLQSRKVQTWRRLNLTWLGRLKRKRRSQCWFREKLVRCWRLWKEIWKIKGHLKLRNKLRWLKKTLTNCLVRMTKTVLMLWCHWDSTMGKIKLRLPHLLQVKTFPTLIQSYWLLKQKAWDSKSIRYWTCTKKETSLIQSSFLHRNREIKCLKLYRIIISILSSLNLASIKQPSSNRNLWSENSLGRDPTERLGWLCGLLSTRK